MKIHSQQLLSIHINVYDIYRAVLHMIYRIYLHDTIYKKLDKFLKICSAEIALPDTIDYSQSCNRILLYVSVKHRQTHIIHKHISTILEIGNKKH